MIKIINIVAIIIIILYSILFFKLIRVKGIRKKERLNNIKE
jgi:hypothetical protein